MKYTFPANYGENVVLVPIDTALVPIISGALNKFFVDTYWETREDYELGYNAFAELLKNMTGSGMKELIEAVNRVYRLLDTALNGVAYSASVDPLTGDQVVTPAIPAAPTSAAPTAARAMRARLARLHELAENAATGAESGAGESLDGTVALDFDGSWSARLLALQGTTGGFFGVGATPVQLADLLQSGRVNTEADQGLINDGVQEVLGTLAAGGSVADVIADILGTGADVATDGGLAALQIALAAAAAAQNGVLAGQIDRIIRALDGGGLTPPAGNVITTLEHIDTMLS